MPRNSLSRCSGNNYDECIRCETQAGRVAVIANLALALFMAFIGYASGSKAILGDALFSFKDFVTSLVVYIGSNVSGRPADDQHPYGHGKIEFVSLFLISICLIIATIFLFIHSTSGFLECFRGDGKAPGLIAFWAAVISVVANYKLSTYLRCVGEKLHSPSMLANARHNHSDAISSVMVAVAVLGARMGLVFLDPLVAVIETVFLFIMGIGMLNDSLKGIFDFAAHPGLQGQIERLTRIVPGVRRLTKVVVRQLGQGLWVEITIQVDQNLRHQEGYLIGQHVKATVESSFTDITKANVTIEPFMP
jgi:cation diffusion facilitator family transporter